MFCGPHPNENLMGIWPPLSDDPGSALVDHNHTYIRHLKCLAFSTWQTNKEREE